MQMYRFGEVVELDRPLTPDDVQAILDEAHRRTAALQAQPLERVVALLDRVGQAWQSPDYPWRRRALQELPDEIRFSGPMIEQGILALIDLLRRENLVKRLDVDLGAAGYLDGWLYHPRFGGFMLAQPLGVVAHVSAGNVFVGGVDTLIQGLVTKNVSIMKMSSADPLFPLFFAQSLRELDEEGVLSRSLALIHWPGGSSDVEKVLKQGANAIVVYGGAETVRSYREDLGLHTKLIEYGPKYSFVLVDAAELARVGLAAAARRIARDVVMWEQSACSSPHAVYVENPEGATTATELSEALTRALAEWAKELPPGGMSEDEATEITRVRELAKVDEVLGTACLYAPHGTEWTVVLQKDPSFQTSCLNRTIFVKPVARLEEAVEALRPMGAFIQTAAILADLDRAKALGLELARIGADRFVEIGHMAVRQHGTPHDGTRGLAELVRWVSLGMKLPSADGAAGAGPTAGGSVAAAGGPEEAPPAAISGASGAPAEAPAGPPSPPAVVRRWDADPHWRRYDPTADDFDFLPDAERDAVTLARLQETIEFARGHAPLYRERFGAIRVETLDDLRRLPILTGDDLKEFVPPNGTGLLTDTPTGYVFNSGGTTGKPKMAYRTAEEQHYNTLRIGKGLRLAVFGPGDVVANLMFAGGMWASFISTNQALEHTGCRLLPIAGNVVDVATQVQLLREFGANAAVILPSILLSLGEYVEQNRVDFRLPKVATAGEHLFTGAKEYLRRVLGIETFASAGYASNDTGAMGYQCPHSQDGVHHIHEDLHYLEILDPETLEPVEEGQAGKIIVTNLQRRLMPTIRYDIGDMGRWVTGVCACGRRTRRFDLLGRSDDVLIMGGANIYPAVVAAAIDAVPGLSEHFQMVGRLQDQLDQLLVRVEQKPGANVDPAQAAAALKAELYAGSKELRTWYERRLIADIGVEVLPPGTLPRNPRTGKVKVTVDERHI